MKKRKDGRLQKCFTVNNKRYVVYGHTTKELFEAEQRKRAEIEEGIEKRYNPTFAEYAYKWNEAKQGQVVENTLRYNKMCIKAVSSVIIPTLDIEFTKVKLKDIRIDDLRLLQRELAKTRQTRTVNHYMVVIRSIINDAYKENVIQYNPALLLKDLKETEERCRDTKHRALTLDEQKRFFESERCKSSFYNNVYRLALLTGMRLGEIASLKNSDVKNGFICIERTLTRLENGTYCIGNSAKTESGRRKIPITPQIQEVLNSQNRINDMLDGNIKGIDDLIFRSSRRGFLGTEVDKEIKRICKTCGVDCFTLHGLRATFATRCIEGGMNPRTLQELLGHKSFKMTMDLYTHCLDDTKSEEMEKIKFVI
ncbi:MAG: site-specific integrase [Lachnospiraceae bacterium]|nr:site-specific integrase [Lachnospiraceae bacterium]